MIYYTPSTLIISQSPNDNLQAEIPMVSLVSNDVHTYPTCVLTIPLTTHPRLFTALKRA